MIKFVDLLIILLAFTFFSCKNYENNETHPDISKVSIWRGKKLAEKYCALCHALPDPSSLTVETWEFGVLPNMAPRLGIFKHNFQQYPSARNDKYLDSNFYPSKPLLTPEQWQNIIDYYVSNSPDSLPRQARSELIKNDLPLFKAVVPSFNYDSSAISFIKIDTNSLQRHIILCDIRKQQIFCFDNSLHLLDSIQSPGSIVDMAYYKNKVIACDIGILNPTNGKFGRGMIFTKKSNQHWKLDSVPLFNTLARPVEIIPSDLNRDGYIDYVICEFGNLTGSLSWMEGKGNKKYLRHELKALPGAIKVYVNDYNNDGLPDLWALFTQGKESIILFTNKGDGQFEQKELLQFPPEFGSSYFELCDFNNDGFSDILYTCGDNADFSMILKPYHGVYIFLNDGKNNFKRKYFFPINGCFKAMARDYDNDGDLDIAAIAFFPDYAKQPEEGFVYLKNTGNFKFEPYTLAELKSGRWLTMDAGDIDGDGREDIVLGNFSIRPSIIPSEIDWKKGPPFVLLKNTENKIK